MGFGVKSAESAVRTDVGCGDAGDAQGGGAADAPVATPEARGDAKKAAVPSLSPEAALGVCSMRMRRAISVTRPDCGVGGCTPAAASRAAWIARAAAGVAPMRADAIHAE